jgi:hypothetical protein
MGHSSSSFISWVGGRSAGHASEINEDRVTLPEKDLWVAVLTRAVLDACKGPPKLDMTKQTNIPHKNLYGYNHRAARHFFLSGGPHFREICEMAGRNPDYVRQKVRKILLRKDGWNVDVPITSHYRQGPKRKRGRPRKEKYRSTHPAGNAYFTAIGKKGGRPKLYGV